jgi:hypothetical protein
VLRKGKEAKGTRGNEAVAKAREARGGRTVTSRDLAARGVPASAVQSWIRAGALLQSGDRGVYRTTKETEARIAAYLAARRSSG